MWLTSSEHLIWIVCAAFYLFDQIKHCAADQLIVREHGARWLPILPCYRFLLRGRAFTILNPLLPCSTVVSMSWLSSGSSSGADIRRQVRLIGIITRRLMPVRVAACIAFSGLFVVGPVATELAGIGLGVVLVVPLLMITWLIMGGSLLTNRTRLGLRTGQLAWVLTECAICPGYFANVWRRLLIERLGGRVDAISFCATTMDAAERHDLLYRLTSYFEDLRERQALVTGDEDAFLAYCHLLQR